MHPTTGPSPLRVLLFSPLVGLDPLSGDTSYTDALLADPPAGVIYTTYRQAIEDGSVRIRGRKPWHSTFSPAELGIFLLRSLETGLRKSTVMFRESVNFISVEPGVFDIIHQHLPAVRQVGPRLPVVSGAGYPLTELYRSREGWGEAHLKLALALESSYASALDVHNPWLRPTDNGVMTVYGDHFRDWLIKRGVDPGQVRLSGTALPDLGLAAKRSNGRTVGIIARDFARKGGDVALDAFRRLYSVDPSWQLLVATTAENAARIQPGSNIEVVVDPSRATVLTELLPRIDILLAPTRSDCGAPYALLEALQAGTCVVTSDIPWLDERLTGAGVRRVRADPSSVADAVRDLVAEGLPAAQAEARALWQRSFSMARLHETLRTAYRQALSPAAADTKGPAPVEVGGRLRLLVAGRPFDLSAARYDGFVARHRRFVRDLARVHDVTILSLRPDSVESSQPVVDGVEGYLDADMAAKKSNRSARLASAIRAAIGIELKRERELASTVAEVKPDAVITIGPWLNKEYRPLWRRYASVHLFEEDLNRMPEIAPQSRQAKYLRAVEAWLHSLSRAQPLTVVSISRIESRSAARLFRSSAHSYLPFTLDPDEWPRFTTTSKGETALAVGNFSEGRNAEGLADVLAEMQRRGDARESLKVDIVSGPGLHELLSPFLGLDWVRRVTVPDGLTDVYRQSWAAIVPARRLTGQKTTILQAWNCGVPVVCSREAAETVGAVNSVLVGEDAAGIVDGLLRLRQDRLERERLAAAGFADLERFFNPVTEAGNLRRIVTVAVARWAARSK